MKNIFATAMLVIASNAAWSTTSDGLTWGDFCPTIIDGDCPATAIEGTDCDTCRFTWPTDATWEHADAKCRCEDSYIKAAADAAAAQAAADAAA